MYGPSSIYIVHTYGAVEHVHYIGGTILLGIYQNGFY